MKSDKKYCNGAMPCVPPGVSDHSDRNGVLGLPPDAMVQEIDCIEMGHGITFLFYLTDCFAKHVCSLYAWCSGVSKWGDDDWLVKKVVSWGGKRGRNMLYVYFQSCYQL